MTATTARHVGRHHRHLLELASLLATAGLADAFADVFGERRHGSSALVALGLALIAGTVGHHVWLRRTDHAPPRVLDPGAPETPASAVPTAAAASSATAARASRVPRVVPVQPPTTTTTAPHASGVFWRVRTEIDNTPGRLAVFAGALAAAGANIQALEVHPAPAGVVDEFLVEASPQTSAEQLCAAVGAVGGRGARAVPADVLALFDAPTRALELAARLSRGAAPLAAVLADLLDADTVEIHDDARAGAFDADRDAVDRDGIDREAVDRDAAGHGRTTDPGTDADPGAGTDVGVGVGESCDVAPRARPAGTVEPCHRTGFRATTLRLRLADGRTLTATRPGMPFTGTERARARAMAELAAALRPHPRTLSEGRGKMSA